MVEFIKPQSLMASLLGVSSGQILFNMCVGAFQNCGYFSISKKVYIELEEEQRHSSVY